VVQKPIIPRKPLLFLDEIQEAPQAIAALRYFYEQVPELHVIAAGSLLEFALQHTGLPVGRLTLFHLYPMTFIEFLSALDNELFIKEVLELKRPLSESIHEKLLELVGLYIGIGGMPAAVRCWKETKSALECFNMHHDLVNVYKRDFEKYANKFQQKYIELIFSQAPRLLGRRFMYQAIEGDYRKRELAPAIKLLMTAGLIHKVTHSDGHGIPLSAEANPEYFKILFIDIALAQAVLQKDMSPWFLDPLGALINKGEIVESFVGQELLGYSNPRMDTELYYWLRAARSSQSEVDYLIQDNELVIPIEVKSGTGSRLYSLHKFLEGHPKTPYGVRFSGTNYSIVDKVHSYPLYAIAGAFKHFNMVGQKIKA